MFNLSKLEKEMHILASRLKKYDENFEKPGDECVQHFVSTYELCIKIIVQYLEKSLCSPSEVEYLSFEQVIRKAYRVSIRSEELQDLEKD